MLNLNDIVRNDLQRIVAVEPEKDGTATLFRRTREDTVERLSVPFKPWLLLANPALAEELTGVSELIALPGNGVFTIRALFQDTDAYYEALKTLKKVTGKTPSAADAPYRVFSDLSQQFLSTYPARLFGGMAFNEIRRLQLDIETHSIGEEHFPDPKRPDDAIFLVSLKDSTGWEKYIVIENNNELALLQELIATIQERDPDVIEGHNIFNFDLNYILTRCKMHKLPFAIGRDGSQPSQRESRFSAGEKIIPFTRCDIYGRHVIDTLHLVNLYDVSHRDMDSHGLKASAKYFNVALPERTYVEGNRISKLFFEAPQTIIKYCMDDARETDALSRILSPSYFYQTQLVPLTYQSVITRGNATRIDALLCAEYLMRNAPLPEPAPPAPLQGALTASEECGIFHNVWHVDVRSLYPSIIIAKQLTPASDKEGIFLRLLTALRQFRLAAKDARKTAPPEKRDEYDALQSTFKILINSFYGYTGFAQGTFNDFNMASLITATGREILSGMRDFLVNSGATVIEMDTDGIYFTPPVGQDNMQEMEHSIQATLPPGIEIELDASYKAMFGYKSKNYALLHQDGKVTIAGAALKSRGAEPYQRRFISQAVTLMLNDRLAEVQPLYEKYMDDIENHNLPISDFAQRENLSTSPQNYADKLKEGKTKRSAAYELALASGKDYKVGDAVEYYVTGNKKSVSVTDNSRLLSNAPTDSRDENIPYYISKLQQLYKKLTEFAN